MRTRFAVAVLAAGLACQPDVKIRRADIPVQTTLTALRALYAPDTVISCRLPALERLAATVTLDSPDHGLRIPLPAGWHQRPPGDSSFGEPESVAEGPDAGRVRLTRITNGGSGPAYLRSTSPGDLIAKPACAVQVGDAGAIWRLYDRAPGATAVSRLPYIGYGEVITVAGRRYRVAVSASTADGRDRLARRVSDAATKADAEVPQ